VLAAGHGKRLRPLTNDRPKCLVDLFGRPLLDYQVHAYRAAGLNDVTVVAGHCADAVESRGVPIYRNPDYRETNMVHSLFRAAAAAFRDDDDLLVAYGDIVFVPGVLDALVASHADLGVVVDLGWRELWAYRMDDPLSDAETLVMNADGDIEEIGGRPASYDRIQGQYVGLIRIAGRIKRRLATFFETVCAELDEEGRKAGALEMTTFLQLVADRLMPVRAVPVRHGWLEIDTPRDLERYRSLPRDRPDLFDVEAFPWIRACLAAANRGEC